MSLESMPASSSTLETANGQGPALPKATTSPAAAPETKEETNGSTAPEPMGDAIAVVTGFATKEGKAAAELPEEDVEMGEIVENKEALEKSKVEEHISSAGEQPIGDQDGAGFPAPGAVEEATASAAASAAAAAPAAAAPTPASFSPVSAASSHPSATSGGSGSGKTPQRTGLNDDPQARAQLDKNRAEQAQKPARPKKYCYKMPELRSTADYEKLVLVGKGTYGKVYKARHKGTGEIVALKKIGLANENEGIPITAVREIKILRMLNHRNVLGLKDIVTDKSRKKLTMVIEYMDHDLTGLIGMHGKWLAEEHIKCFVKQLIEGLFHCHSRKVLHRDVKGANMLINNNGILKLADFGLARKMRDDGKYTNRVVTLWYRAPELLLGAKDYGPAVDMWSVGCILVELHTGRVAFAGKSEHEQLHLIYGVCGTPSSECKSLTSLPEFQNMKPKKNYKPCLKQHLHKMNPNSTIAPETFDLISKLLEMDPTKRLTAHEALEHDYFYKGILPCQPDQIPKFSESCHELEAKKRRLERDEIMQQNKKYKDNHGNPAARAGRGGGQVGRYQDNRRNGYQGPTGGGGGGGRHSGGQYRYNDHGDRGSERGGSDRGFSRGMDRGYGYRSHNPEYQPPPRHFYGDRGGRGRDRPRSGYQSRGYQPYPAGGRPRPDAQHRPSGGGSQEKERTAVQRRPTPNTPQPKEPGTGEKRKHSQL